MSRIIKFSALVMAIVVCLFACACKFEEVKTSDTGKTSESYLQEESAIPETPADPAVESAKIDLMAGYTAAAYNTVELGAEFTKIYNDFAVNIFKQTYKGENELLSPLSIQVALAMVANGSANDTKAQMQSVLFGGQSTDKYNDFAKSYLAALNGYDKISVKVANAVWFKNTSALTVKERFLQTNADYYNATAYKAPFNDATLNDINGWVYEHTDKMIDKVLEEINPLAMLYLLNAVAFNADWSVPFEEAFSDTFKNAEGQTENVKMMRDTVYAYLENDVAEGFVKNYKGGRFAFACMLPKDGESLDTVVSSLTGDSLTEYFNSRKAEKTYLKMPKFKLDYSIKLNKVLSDLGMDKAFSPDNADFTDMAELLGGNIYIGTVIHKTAIEVNETGTVAAAVTAVGMDGATASIGDIKVHYVYLKKPFIYFLLDTQTKTPLFMGEISTLN